MFKFLLFTGVIFAQTTDTCQANAEKRGCEDNQVQTFVKLSAEDQENEWTDNRRFLIFLLKIFIKI